MKPLAAPTAPAGAAPKGAGEWLALAAAVGLHVGLVAVLLLRPNPRPLPAPQRMEVTLAGDIGPTATAPKPAQAAAEDIAPTLGDAPPPPAPAPAPPAPAPVMAPPPVPVRHPPPPRPAPKAEPRPEPKAEPRPVVAQPAPARHHEAPRPLSAIDAAMAERKPAPAEHKPAPPKPAPAKPAPAKAEPAKAAPAKAAATPSAHKPAHSKADSAASADADSPPAKHVGGSRLGADFLKGLTSQQSNGKAKTAPAPTVGPAVRQALAGAIARSLKRYWRVPQGVDTDQLVTYLAFDLNRDGSLAGPPRVLRQEGVNANNRLQAGLHRENAIRAVELAAKDGFGLPPEYYDAWKHLTNVRFDRNLSQ